MNVYNIHMVNDDAYKNHQMLKELFPEQGKILYQRTPSKLIVLTDIDLDCKFKEEFNIELIGKSSDVIDNIREETLFSIRLNASKAYSKLNKDNKNVKRYSLVKEEIPSWVDKKLSDIGANISYRNIKDEGVIISERKQCRCYHASVLVVGFLTIIDVEKFSDVVHNGIGRGKAFGFGLMNVFGM